MQRHFNCALGDGIYVHGELEALASDDEEYGAETLILGSSIRPVDRIRLVLLAGAESHSPRIIQGRVRAV